MGKKSVKSSCREVTHLKKFLKIFAGESLLPPGVVGVVGVTGAELKPPQLIEMLFYSIWPPKLIKEDIYGLKIE